MVVNFQQKATKRPAAECGVSLQFLLDFAAKARDAGQLTAGTTTGDVVQTIILPQTKSQQCSYVDLLGGGQVSTPTFHICHRWASTFQLLLDAVLQFFNGVDPADVYLWLDIFAVSQHPGAEHLKDIDDIEMAVEAAAGTIVVMDHQGALLTRAWCLLELWATFKHHGCQAIHIITPGFSLHEVGSAFLVVDVRQAATGHPNDRTRIMDRVSGSDGKGHRDLNMNVRLLYSLAPLDYKAQLSSLVRSARINHILNKTYNKHLGPYIDWLFLQPAHANYKCFAIYGSSGTGKTTLAASLCVSGGKDAAEMRPHAYHFCKQGDWDRMDPIKMMRSLLYQLAHSIPDIQPYVMNLDPTRVHKLTKVDQAFSVLLRIPLTRLARDGKAPAQGVIFLVDGLDEANGKTGNFDNPIMLVLREFFPALPSFCRLVVTCRPPHECPHIVGALEYKFCPMQVCPYDLFQKEDILNMLEVRLNGLMDSPAGIVEAAEKLLARGKDSVLYAMTVMLDMREQQQISGTRHWSLEELEGKLPNNLAAAYATLIGRALAVKGVAEHLEGVRQLMQVVVAAREPLDLKQVQRLGLAKYVDLLPGYGTLFVISNYKLQVAHKTILEWLQSLDPTQTLETEISSLMGSLKASNTPAAANSMIQQVHTDFNTSGANQTHQQLPASRSHHDHQTHSHQTTDQALKLNNHGHDVVATIDRRNSVCPLSPKPGGAEQSQQGHTSQASPHTPSRCDHRGSSMNPMSPVRSSVTRGQHVAGPTGAQHSTPHKGHAAEPVSPVVRPSTVHHHALSQEAIAALSAAAAAAGLLESGGPDEIITFSIDVAAGHAAIASMVHEDALRSKVPDSYSLRHTVAHLCLSGDQSTLEAVVLEFDFWQRVYAAGFGPDVFKDLMELAPSSSAISHDVVRWLRGVSEALVKQPRAALQLAHDAPACSYTARAAARYHRKPDAYLVNKEEDWSPCIMTMRDVSNGAGKVTQVCFSPDGNQIASGSTAKTVRLWDAKTGQQVAVLEGPSSVFSSVAFAPDNTKVVSGAADKTVRLWDAKTGEQLETLEGHKDTVNSVCFSPDSSKVASGSADKAVRLWDVKIGEELAVLEGHRDSVNSIAFTPDGHKVASGSADRTVRLWDTKTFKMLTLLEGHFGVIYGVCCSPYSTQIASCSADKTVRLWDSETGQQAWVLEGHNAVVNAVCYAPDASRLASASADKTVRIWDAKTYQQLLVVERQSGIFTSICFSSDGCQVASGSSDKSVRFWDAKTGEEVGVLEGHQDAVNSISLSPDGVKAASGSVDKTVRLWDVKAEKQMAVLKGHSGVFSCVAFSPDGKYLASGSDDKTVRMWDAKTGQQTAVAEGHIEAVTSVCFSPDGSQLASASDDKTVRLWDITTGHQISTPWSMSHSTGTIRSVAWSPNGLKLATGSADMYKTVRIWDAKTGKQLQEMKGHFGIVNSVSFSSDSSKIASGAADRSVRIWDADVGQQLAVLEGHTEAVVSVCFCPTSNKVASGGDDKTVRVWVCEGKVWVPVALLVGHLYSINSIAFHPDGSKVASSGAETVRLWSVASSSSSSKVMPEGQRQQLTSGGDAGDLHRRITLSDQVKVLAGVEDQSEGLDEPNMRLAVSIEGHHSLINCICYSPDGTKVATASYDKTIILWNGSTGRMQSLLKGHSGVVNVVVFSPDSALCASGSADETVRIWDTRTGYQVAVLAGHSNWIRTVAFLSTGTKLASGSDDKTVRLWDVKSGKQLAVLEGHTNWVKCVCFSPDGTRVASGSDDKTVRLWDIKSSRQVLLLEGHTDAINCVAFSPNGALLAAGSDDKVARIWAVSNGKLVAELKGHFGVVNNVQFSPDSSQVVSSGADKSVRVWDAKAGQCIKVLHACSEGMWTGDHFVTISTESGILTVMDSITLHPVAEAFSIFPIREMSCSKRAIACTVAGLENVCIYKLNVKAHSSKRK